MYLISLVCVRDFTRVIPLDVDVYLDQQTATRVLKVQRDTVIMSHLSCLKLKLVSTMHVSPLKSY